MELMIKMSAAEADEAMAKGLIQALVYPFSCREEVRKAAEKTAEKPEKGVQEAITSMPQRKNVALETEQKPVETEQKAEQEAITSMPQRKNVALETEQKPVETEQKAEQEASKAEQAEKDESKYTLDQLSKAAADLITADAGNQEKLLAILRKFSIEAMPELKAEDYGKFAEELKAIGGNL